MRSTGCHCAKLKEDLTPFLRFSLGALESIYLDRDLEENFEFRHHAYAAGK